MNGERRRGCSRRERLELTAAALVPAALGLLGRAVDRGGRVSWLGPLAALPVGLFLCYAWNRLGERDLGGGLEGAFGRWGGRAAEVLYLLWAAVLLAECGARYAQRFQTLFEGEGTRWLFLGTALVLCLWLGRGEGAVLARTGRIFFLAVWVTLGLVLLLALPGVDWRNLWPPERTDWAGLPRSGGLCLSLAGYGVYALCLPHAPERNGEKGWPWAVWGCGALGAALLLVTGTFGPALAAEMEEPFFFLLEGVRVPGAFRRGEAALAAVLALGDVTLLALLTRGCETLWGDLAPGPRWGGAALAAAGFWAAGMLPGREVVWAGLEKAVPVGNLVLDVLLPAFAVLTRRFRERRKKGAIFCGGKPEDQEDVAVNLTSEKNPEKMKKSVDIRAAFWYSNKALQTRAKTE